MKETLQRVDHGVRHLLPFILTLMLLLLQATPTRLPGFSSVAPMLPLIGIYYWSIHRPDLLPGAAAFLLGFVNDIIVGTPLGVNSLVYLLVQGITSSQRRFFLGKPFFVTWWGLGLTALVAIGLEWILVSMLNGVLLKPTAVLVELVMTVAVYPLLSWLLARVQHSLLRVA